jgi:hypothetical protein
VACTAQQKVIRGCVQDAPENYRLNIEGEVHLRCPRRPILDDPAFYRELFWLYRQKEKGYLVNHGGLDDLPTFLADAFRVIDATLSRIEAHKKDEAARKKRRAALTSGTPRKPARGGRRSRRR